MSLLSTLIAGTYVGAQGIQGAQGYQGTDGIQGFQGIQGTQGIQGRQGPQGIQGISTVTLSSTTQGAGYTLAISDRAGLVITNSNVTFPPSVFAVGDLITIYNNNTVSNISLVPGSGVTIRDAGTALTGTRVLVPFGLCTAIVVVAGASPTFVISGQGIE